MRGVGSGTSRRLIGICGPPGSGKSTIAAALAAERSDAVVLPMDGFHLAQEELIRLGRAERKGAPDTFDVAGYVATLLRVRQGNDETIYVPAFDRRLEQPIAGAIGVEPHHQLVVTEGNYLLHRAGGWERIAELLDECWYVDADPAVRRARLVDRHVDHGRSRADAEAWVRSVDEPNTVLIEGGRRRATRVVHNDAAPELLAARYGRVS